MVKEKNNTKYENIPDEYNRNVFINCPFDDDFLPLFHALVFAIHSCGYIVRCAQESGNRDGVRIDKIFKIISECRFGIHDISRIEYTSGGFPRFNMPYELGIFMGCKEYGNINHQKKDFLVLDAIKHRYKITLSDLAGYDFPAHDNKPEKVIDVVRDFLADYGSTSTPGSDFLIEKYKHFKSEFPALCGAMRLNPEKVKFKEFYAIVSAWIQKDNYLMLSDYEIEINSK